MDEISTYDPDLYRIKKISDVNSSNSPLQYTAINKLSATVKEYLYRIPAVKDSIDKFKTSGAVEYVANLTKEQIEQLEKGEIKLGESKVDPGTFNPNIFVPGERGTKGQVTLSRQQLPSDFMSSVVSYTMQRQLQQISQELIEINSKLDFIEQGQRNDRNALVFAARQQFIEASMVEDDPYFQKLLFSQAITTANQARYQLHTSLNSDIECLLTLGQSSHNKKKVNELSLRIRESLTYINVSAIISAKSYAILGQHNSYLETLKSYKAMLDESFYESKYHGETYAQALYDNWDVCKYGNSIDWRALPESISAEIENIVNSSNLIQIDLNELYGINSEKRLVIELQNSGADEMEGKVVLKYE